MNSGDREKTGRLIGRLRREKGLTQRELAEKLFISDKAVSKWETGASMPDTALLIPLAELLGVSVTELLTGETVEDREPVELARAEAAVKSVIGRAEEEMESLNGAKTGMGRIAFAAALLAGGLMCLICMKRLPEPNNVLVTYIIAAVFGLYFHFFAESRLPAYYDENPISNYSRGPVRMNIPGVNINNRNFPHIVRVIRIWTALAVLLCPGAGLMLHWLLPELWGAVFKGLIFAALLPGLVLPIYIVGKKHE